MDEFYGWCDLHQVLWWQMPLTWILVLTGACIIIIWWGYQWWCCWKQAEIAAAISPRDRALSALNQLLTEYELLTPHEGYDRLMKIIKEYYALTLYTDAECSNYLDVSMRDLCRRAESARFFAAQKADLSLLCNDICRIRAIIQDIAIHNRAE